MRQTEIYSWNTPIWDSINNEQARSNHAFILYGNEGVGKRAFAFAFAIKQLGLSQNDSLLLAGTYPDLHILAPESSIEAREEGDIFARYANVYITSDTSRKKPQNIISIEQIRALKQALTTHPHLNQNRVVMIECAEKMNVNSANALLKSLEEPSHNTFFILITDEIAKISATVRSRCSLVRFENPNFDEGIQWLNSEQGIEIEEAKRYLSLCCGQPLLAWHYHKTHFIDTLKIIFTSLRDLWSNRMHYTEAASQWKECGAEVSLDIVQKITIDLIRCSILKTPKNVFFPVQLQWLQKSALNLPKEKLFAMYQEVNAAKKIIDSTVDELLILENISSKIASLTH